MCITPEQVKKAIDEELFQPKQGEENGRLDKHIDERNNKLFWKIVRFSLWPILGFIITGTGLYFSVEKRVTTAELSISEHQRETDRRFEENEKDRDAMQENINAQLIDIKDDVRDIRRAVLGY